MQCFIAMSLTINQKCNLSEHLKITLADLIIPAFNQTFLQSSSNSSENFDPLDFLENVRYNTIVVILLRAILACMYVCSYSSLIVDALGFS